MSVLLLTFGYCINIDLSNSEMRNAVPDDWTTVTLCRYRILNDFGFASLDIDYIRADDAGTYSLVVRNDKGEWEELKYNLDVIFLQATDE